MSNYLIKKVTKSVIAIGEKYKDFDYHVTKNAISVKFTPWHDDEPEVVFCFTGSMNDESLLELRMNLEMHLHRLNCPDTVTGESL